VALTNDQSLFPMVRPIAPDTRNTTAIIVKVNAA
jgi:hypothetical protein